MTKFSKPNLAGRFLFIPRLVSLTHNHFSLFVYEQPSPSSTHHGTSSLRVSLVWFRHSVPPHCSLLPHTPLISLKCKVWKCSLYHNSCSLNTHSSLLTMIVLSANLEWCDIGFHWNLHIKYSPLEILWSHNEVKENGEG